MPRRQHHGPAAGGDSWDSLRLLALIVVSTAILTIACFTAALARTLGLVPGTSNTDNGLLWVFLLTLSGRIKHRRSIKEGDF
jgi:hypothetical protein